MFLIQTSRLFKTHEHPGREAAVKKRQGWVGQPLESAHRTEVRCSKLYLRCAHDLSVFTGYSTVDMRSAGPPPPRKGPPRIQGGDLQRSQGGLLKTPGAQRAKFQNAMSRTWQFSRIFPKENRRQALAKSGHDGQESGS